MFWIHCNECGSQPLFDQVEIYVSNCGHFFCKSCLQSRSEKTSSCFVCKASPVRFLKVDKNLKPEILSMFEDPSFSLKKACRTVEFQEAQAQNLYNLQKKNVSVFGNKLKATSTQVALLQDQLLDEKKRNKELNDECSKLRVSVENLKEELKNKSYPQQNHLRPNQEHNFRQMNFSRPLQGALNSNMFEPLRDSSLRKYSQESFSIPTMVQTNQTFADLPTNIFSSAKTPDVFRYVRPAAVEPKRHEEGLFGRTKTNGQAKFPFIT